MVRCFAGRIFHQGSEPEQQPNGTTGTRVWLASGLAPAVHDGEIDEFIEAYLKSTMGNQAAEVGK